MTPPKWTRAGMAARAMISRNKYTIFVEGKSFDAPYYDRLLGSVEEIQEVGVEIVRSFDVSDADTGTGGKAALLDLYTFYEKNGTLSFSTKRGSKFLVFFLDRDYDEFGAGLQSSPHIVYTYGTDVEAEIFRRGRLSQALATALHLTTRESVDLEARIGNFRLDLATSWKEWIKLCIASVPLRSRCEVRPSSGSLVNQEKYGPLDSVEYERLKGRLIETSVVDDPELALETVMDKIDRCFIDLEIHKLLKGKWIAAYIEHKIVELHQPSNNQLKSFTPILTSAMLDSITFDSLATHHHRRLLALDS
ncbi:hypothetical protein [Pseudarthrobacter sp. lyk4-40-TYG-27]|uniref:hypothetical protein n=1 Tax=Pseudarthrobacter sp. lyk4-40-TYG-27 TaxID=3040305 RepID=UPI0025558459|nr:hypothetical protein [Pseudarthrobacter sp. lyk4-40-TYG-27]